MKTLYQTVIGVFAALLIPLGHAAAEPLRVVTTLPAYADITRTIGGDSVEVHSVVQPRFNPHFIEPRPSDVLKVKRADLFIHSGLDYELWRFALVDAAGNLDVRPGGKHEIDLSQSVRLLDIPVGNVTRAGGDIHVFGNPHFTLDPENGRSIAVAICARLTELNPAAAKRYENNLSGFLRELAAKILEWRRTLSLIAGKQLVGYHNEWVYLMNFAALHMERFLEPKPGIPPSPRDLEEIEEYIRERNVKAVIQASFYPREASDEVAARTGATVLMLCQNVGELPECSSYISMLEHNFSMLLKGLA